jgi:hypothetical protein
LGDNAVPEEHEERRDRLPTWEDLLRGLPRRAVIAFAARCARRVQPLFPAEPPSGFPPDKWEKHRLDVALAIDAAERYAGGRNNKPPAADADARAADAAAAAAAAAARAAAFAAAAAAAARAADAADTSSIRRDFDLLCGSAHLESWTEDTPIPPEFFGPLWPMGRPAWAPP